MKESTQLRRSRHDTEDDKRKHDGIKTESTAFGDENKETESSEFPELHSPVHGATADPKRKVNTYAERDDLCIVLKIGNREIFGVFPLEKTRKRGNRKSVG
jgi:hypothetical protein